MSSFRNSISAAPAHAVTSRTWRRVLGVAVFAIATAISAKVWLLIPGTPIPFTFQPLVVLLAGGLLGARLGAASQITYLAMGMAGLPVFALGGGAAYLLGPTGGYLMAYPLAAFVVGAAMRTGLGATLLALLAGLATIYAGGLAWLSATGSFDAAVVWGLQPFVLADLVKVGLAAAVIARLRNRSLDTFAR